MSDRTSSESEVFYDAVLQAQRSLPPRGFAVLMLVLAGVSFAIALVCVLHGAWPVTPFFGLDVALVYVAFCVSYRRAKLREELRLTEERLTVERVSPRGERRRWQFQPFWLRVVLEERDETNRLVLASHGRELVVGGFLAPAERKSLAVALKDALLRWREHINPVRN